MLATVLVVLVVAVAALLLYAASRPDSFRLERSTTVDAPPEKIFPLIADFRSWGAWSPWENLDPALKRSYSGAASGKGSVYEYEGNSKVGQGRMEILEADVKSAAPSKVDIKLDFLKPFEAHNKAIFTLEPQGPSTRVTWAMEGPSPFITRLMGVFFSMDKMVGKDFEKGLAAMKAAAEK